MPEGTKETFSVLAAEERLPDFAVTAKILSEFNSININDAGRLARHCWGILGSRLAPDSAQELTRKCEAYGVKTITLFSTGTAGFKPAALIKKASFADGSFSFTNAAGLSMNVAAADILVLSAAPHKEETVKTVKSVEGPSGGEKALRLGIMAATGLPIGMGKNKEVKKEVRTSETAFTLDIILKQPATRLRLTPADFDFSCLREKKTCSSQTNFYLLCAALSLFAPGALKNTGLWAIIEHKPLSALPYDSMEDFETETRRLAALAAAVQ